jgi:acetyl-CoA/propionyl-CoA/long-chain acyl-CoA carboxylase, biotin carboxylase, biotin carboxyl carrier protein
MIARVLVANRGEIAVRVIRACHRLGIEAVVVHSDPDAHSMAVALADDAVAIPGSSSADTYLDVNRVMHVAVASRCDAVHPGYGFLAERADVASAVIDAGLTWIGPAPDVIALMGDKLAARRVARDAGVPPVPGAVVAVEDPVAVQELGEQLGWPLAVKAVHGGGGRGMRVVNSPGDVAEALSAASREAHASFGRADVYVERFLTHPRHVEVQVVADHHGGLVVVGDRDCSIQRRYQKLIEEAPAPHLPESVRASLADAASRLGLVVGYTNVGTVEFLVEGEEHFFLEMNTRIQVEHPVTELVTGVDLVVEQIRIADDQPLSFNAADVVSRGAAIEVRINAEDASGGRFLPVPGTLRRFEPPAGPHVRVDTGFRAGDELAPQYDNLIAKIAVWGTDREDARKRALQALAELRVDGVPTTAPLAAAILAHDDFRNVAHSTRWLEKHATDLLPAATANAGTSTTERTPSVTSNGPPTDVEVLGRWYRIPRFDDRSNGTNGANGAADDSTAPPVVAGGGPARRQGSATPGHRPGDGQVTAPMQGTVTAVDVQVGDTVAAATRVVALEAMKMENALLAGVDGVVTAVHVAVGANVAPGALLVEVR